MRAAQHTSFFLFTSQLTIHKFNGISILCTLKSKKEKKVTERNRFIHNKLSENGWLFRNLFLLSSYLPFFSIDNVVRFRFFTADEPLFVAELRRVAAT